MQTLDITRTIYFYIPTIRQHPLFGKLQYTDKCSLPASVGRELYRKPYEVPWIFEVKKARALLSDSADTAVISADMGMSESSPLDRVYLRYVLSSTVCVPNNSYLYCYILF